jgi:hypothetical protein
MKKKKINIFPLKSTFLGDNITFIWGDTYYNMAQYVEKVEKLDTGVLRNIAYSDEERSIGLTTHNPEAPKNIYIFLSDKPKNIRPTVVHELMHALFMVLEDVGANPMDSEGEWFAYWVGDCIRQLEGDKLF